jgi:hypothetical protein
MKRLTLAPKDDLLVDSWSELEEVLDKAMRHSMPCGNDREDTMSSLNTLLNKTALLSAEDYTNARRDVRTSVPSATPTQRRATLTDAWICKACTYRNIDIVAVFCGVCGGKRM